MTLAVTLVLYAAVLALADAIGRAPFGRETETGFRFDP
jgi:hypothetical protein